MTSRSLRVKKDSLLLCRVKKALDGEYRDIAHPINSETRERIQSIILEKYEEALNEEEE